MKNWIIEKLLWVVCKLSDDYMYTLGIIEEWYDNVPDEIQGAKIKCWTIWMYYGDKREKALKWLNEEDK